MAAIPYHRANTTASLYTLVSASQRDPGATDINQEVDGQLRINFPAMPETVSLARQVNYESVRSPAIPDGFHWYRNTEPLVIPIKFSLAGFDKDYCQADGPYALLDMAAKLHAMTMPIIPSTSNDTRQAGRTNGVAFSADGTEATYAAAKTGGVGVNTARITSKTGANGEVTANVNPDSEAVYFPPACVLSIILAELPGRPKLGIQCIGFVTSVDVTFHGPWLQSSDARGSALVNLPARADFEFRFTHQPNYTNNYKANSGVHGRAYTTTAAMVRNRLYNQFASNTAKADSVAFADLFGRSSQRNQP